MGGPRQDCSSQPYRPECPHSAGVGWVTVQRRAPGGKPGCRGDLQMGQADSRPVPVLFLGELPGVPSCNLLTNPLDPHKDLPVKVGWWSTSFRVGALNEDLRTCGHVKGGLAWLTDVGGGSDLGSLTKRTPNITPDQ